MTIYSEILGNVNSPEWHERIMHDPEASMTNILLDQWTAQKSRFLGKGDDGQEYAVALARNARVADGDIIAWDPATKRAVVIRLELNPVLVVDLSKLASKPAEDIIRTAVEVGHAIGNQHWPAVVKGTKIYVPLTVDRKVMISVMETHGIADISYDFQSGSEVIPYMAPDEVRRLFGGAGHEPEEMHEHHHHHDHHH